MTEIIQATRRSAMAIAAGLGALSGLSPLSTRSARAQGRPAGTFVLVHGAYGGGYVWKYVAERLRAQGHRVYTPTLTGLGDRSHLMSKDVRLETHIADIVNLIRWEDLRNVTLVAHSYGGWPASGVPEHVGEAIGSIVYLDAFTEGRAEGSGPEFSPQPRGGARGNRPRRGLQAAHAERQ